MNLGRDKHFLLVSEGIWHWYAPAAAAGLRELGYSVSEFDWSSTFMEHVDGHVEPKYKSLPLRIEERIAFGPSVRTLNARLIQAVQSCQPDFILFYNVRLVQPQTIRRIKKLAPRAILGQYANDNPFSEHASPGYWRHFIRGARLFDITFAYRPDNLSDYSKIGVTNARLLRSYFLPWQDYPVPPHDLMDTDRSDLIFAGHYENDGRLEVLTALVQETGASLRLHGGGWEPVLRALPQSHPLARQYPAEPVVGARYREAISGAKVALCFLSRKNKDTYTRRNFEIPAIGTAMLSTFSSDLAGLFAENQEVCFFRDKHEAVEQTKRLLNDDSYREKLALGGHQRVHDDGHDVVSRMRIVAEAFDSQVDYFGKEQGA